MINSLLLLSTEKGKFSSAVPETKYKDFCCQPTPLWLSMPMAHLRSTSARTLRTSCNRPSVSSAPAITVPASTEIKYSSNDKLYQERGKSTPNINYMGMRRFEGYLSVLDSLW